LKTITYPNRHQTGTMVFNSLNFAIFFTTIFILYWLLRGSYRWQNLLLLIGNYVFYGWWNWRFLIIIGSISVVSLVASGLIQDSDKKRLRLLTVWAACLFIVGTLAIAKYYNFFMASVGDAVSLMGIKLHIQNLKWLVPIGLSYYVFSSIGYIIDVYRGKTKAADDIIGYLAYVSFFPHVLSGPIAQSTHLLPQFLQKRQISRASVEDGVMQFTWGLFKKVVIADALVKNIAYIFSYYKELPGSVLAVGAVLYSFQVYADFSGYSDMACGLGRLLGFDLTQNFKLPFFSRDIGEFWRRWHISLSKWLTQYIYIPLGGRGNSRFTHARNVLITFTFSGLWHGANWTYVSWGFLNGVYFLPSILRGSVKKYENVVAHDRALPSIKELIQMLWVFILVTLSRVIFRSPDMLSAIGYFKKMFSMSILKVPHFGTKGLLWIAGLVLFEWLNRRKRYALEPELTPIWVRYPAFACSVAMISVSLSLHPSTEYIYFKF
jgi:alginate O-acetyltransferase complex protein AlgI